MFKRLLLWLVLVLSLVLLPSLTLAEVYILPHAGVRLTTEADWTLMLPESLDDDLLTELGLDADALLGAYAAEHILAEVYLPAGQVTLAVVETEQSEALRSITRMTDTEKEALAGQYAQMALYQDVVWQSPELLTMHWTLESGGIAVTWLRGITVRQGALYIYTACAPGQTDPEALQVILDSVIGQVEYLGSIRHTAAPLPTPEPTPQPTPAPTPGVAEPTRGVGALTLALEGLPAYTDNTLLSIQGVTEPSARIRVATQGKTLASGQANGRGLFSFDLELPAVDGEHLITFEISRGGAALVVDYPVKLEQRTVSIQITAPTNLEVGAAFDLIVQTLPSATVRLITPNGSLRARATTEGIASFTINVRAEGEHSYELEAMLDGYKDGHQTFTVHRVLSQQELLSNFRRDLETLVYRRLAETPEAYEGRKVEYRARIGQIGEVDGYPCLLVYTANPGTGVWREPVYVICEELLSYSQDQMITILGTVRGDAYELDGQSIPVIEAAFVWE